MTRDFFPHGVHFPLSRKGDKPDDNVLEQDPAVTRLDPAKYSDHRQISMSGGAGPPAPGKYSIPQSVNGID